MLDPGPCLGEYVEDVHAFLLPYSAARRIPNLTALLAWHDSLPAIAMSAFASQWPTVWADLHNFCSLAKGESNPLDLQIAELVAASWLAQPVLQTWEPAVPAMQVDHTAAALHQIAVKEAQASAATSSRAAAASAWTHSQSARFAPAPSAAGSTATSRTATPVAALASGVETTSAAADNSGMAAIPLVRRANAAAATRLMQSLDGPPRAKPHANDANALWAASPYHELAKGTDVMAAIAREVLAATPSAPDAAVSTSYAAHVPPSWLKDSTAMPSVAPIFSSVRMLEEHRRADIAPCPACVGGTCAAPAYLASLTKFYPPFAPGELERLQAAAVLRAENYCLGSVEETQTLRSENATALARGIAAPSDVLGEAPIVISPQFVVTKYRYIAAADAATAVAKDSFLSDLNKRVQEAVDHAVATEPPDHALLNASRRMVVSSKLRLVVDWSRFLNASLVKWSFSCLVLSEFLATCSIGGWLASVDMEGGYHHAILDPRFRKFAGVEVDGMVMTRLRSVMGCSSEPAHFSLASGEVCGFMRRLVLSNPRLSSAKAAVSALLDDLYAVAAAQPAANELYDALLQYCSRCGIKLNDKSQPPSHRAVIMGIVVDLLHAALSLPDEKRYNLAMLITLCLEVNSRSLPVPPSVRRSLAGKLSAASLTVPGSRIHLQSLYKQQYSTMPLSSQLVEDLAWWLRKLAAPGTVTRLVAVGPAASCKHVVHSLSDASGDIGFGLVAGNVVLHGRCKAGFDGHIAVKELAPIVLFLLRFGKWFRGCTFAPSVDSSVVFFAISKGATKDELLRAPLSLLFTLCDVHMCEVLPDWFPRDLNEFSDGLSNCATVAEALHVCRVRLQAAGITEL